MKMDRNTQLAHRGRPPQRIEVAPLRVEGAQEQGVREPLLLLRGGLAFKVSLPRAPASGVGLPPSEGQAWGGTSHHSSSGQEGVLGTSRQMSGID